MEMVILIDMPRYWPSVTSRWLDNDQVLFCDFIYFSRDQPLVSDHRLRSTKLDSFNINFTHLSFRNGLLKRVTDHFWIESQTVKQKSGLVVMDFPNWRRLNRKCSTVALFRYWPLYASEINHILSPKRKWSSIWQLLKCFQTLLKI